MYIRIPVVNQCYTYRNGKKWKFDGGSATTDHPSSIKSCVAYVVQTPAFKDILNVCCRPYPLHKLERELLHEWHSSCDRKRPNPTDNFYFEPLREARRGILLLYLSDIYTYIITLRISLLCAYHPFFLQPIFCIFNVE